jgi:hypothetical protein
LGTITINEDGDGNFGTVPTGEDTP